MPQNLVPLYIDKITGGIVASKNSNNGNGNANAKGFEFIQVVPILSWVIPHNSNTKKLICQIYNDTDIQVLPNEIQIVDDNLIIVSFTSPMAGSAKIVFF